MNSSTWSPWSLFELALVRVTANPPFQVPEPSQEFWTMLLEVYIQTHSPWTRYFILLALWPLQMDVCLKYILTCWVKLPADDGGNQFLHASSGFSSNVWGIPPVSLEESHTALGFQLYLSLCSVLPQNLPVLITSVSPTHPHTCWNEIYIY